MILLPWQQIGHRSWALKELNGKMIAASIMDFRWSIAFRCYRGYIHGNNFDREETSFSIYVDDFEQAKLFMNDELKQRHYTVLPDKFMVLM